MRLLPDDDEREFAVDCCVDCFSAGVRIPPTLWTLAGRRRRARARRCPRSTAARAATLTDLGVFSVEAGRGLCPTIVHGTIHAGLAIDALGTRRAARRLVARAAPAEGRAPQRLCGHPVDAGDRHATAAGREARRRVAGC